MTATAKPAAPPDLWAAVVTDAESDPGRAWLDVVAQIRSISVIIAGGLRGAHDPRFDSAGVSISVPRDNPAARYFCAAKGRADIGSLLSDLYGRPVTFTATEDHL